MGDSLLIDFSKFFFNKDAPDPSHSTSTVDCSSAPGLFLCFLAVVALRCRIRRRERPFLFDPQKRPTYFFFVCFGGFE